VAKIDHNRQRAKAKGVVAWHASVVEMAVNGVYDEARQRRLDRWKKRLKTRKPKPYRSIPIN
jgi:hypothetical protein